MGAASAPLDTATLRRVGGQMGSHPAGLYEDAQGRRYYVKSLESIALARNEFLAAKLYELAGAPTLTYVSTTQPNQVATEWVALDKKCVAHFTESERRQACEWLGVHAWTANWDVAGFDGDNLGVVDGRVLTLDVGGALAFRAQGDPKGAAFGAQVGEIDSLRNERGNRHAHRLFGGMSEEDVYRSIQKVTRIPEARIRAVVLANGGSAALADRMVARRADLARRLVQWDEAGA